MYFKNSNGKYHCLSAHYLSNQLYAKLSITVKFCACESNYAACATLVPTITLEPSAGASASLLVSAM